MTRCLGIAGLLALVLLSGCTSRPLWELGRETSSPTPPVGLAALRSTPKLVPKPPVARFQARARKAAGRAIVVTRGDTLYALARQHGIPARRLIRDNQLKAPYGLQIGQRLSLPVPRVHIVRKGETGYGISRRYGVNLARLMRLNGIRAPYRLTIGQKLRLPAGSAKRSKPARRKPVRTAASKGFRWPVQGSIISGFGPKPGGIHNDGINIAAEAGASVRAAAAGEVVYASDALEGYGNLVLIRHSSGYITAYAHNQRLLVREGQKVNQGETIARVGTTGGVPTPQLHFEIRRGRQALNPSRFLGQRARGR